MSELLKISTPQPTPAPRPAPTLPHVVELPTRYYNRLALEETIQTFSEVATIEARVGDGVLVCTFTQVDHEAGDVIAEFLNHVLYRSATMGEELSR